MRHIAAYMLIAIGAGITGFSPWIVFPGLERWLGIEAIVGRESVVYQENGGNAFTNPGAMFRWIASVAALGLLLSCTGLMLLLRSRKYYMNDLPQRNVD